MFLRDIHNIVDILVTSCACKQNRKFQSRARNDKFSCRVLKAEIMRLHTFHIFLVLLLLLLAQSTNAKLHNSAMKCTCSPHKLPSGFKLQINIFLCSFQRRITSEGYLLWGQVDCRVACLLNFSNIFLALLGLL